MKLTIKQQKFADFYLEYGNATKAAIEAGYSPKYAGFNADKLLKNTKIKDYIDSRLDEIQSKRIADVAEIMEYLTKGMRQELSEEVVVTEGCGDGISESKIVTKKISLRDSNKCAEMLAKRYGIFNETINVNMEIPKFGGDDELQD